MDEKNVAQDEKPEALDQTKKHQPIRYLLLLILGVLAIVAAAYIVWLLKPADSDKAAESTAYMTNQNAVVCALVESANLQCEDLNSGELHKLNVPEKFQEVSVITPSPDGARLLIETANKGVFVTDADFNEARTIQNVGENEVERNVTFTWSSDSKHLFVAEIGREEGDADFLPEPLVVSMLDVETGDSRRVYKTGERDDVREIEVIGGNNEYVFITLPTTKNWVANEVDPPMETLQAVRLSDGFVLPVNSSQIIALGGAKPPFLLGVTYTNPDLFTFHLNGEASDKLVTTRLETGNFGLQLQVVKTADSGEERSYTRVFTSKGVQLDTLDKDNFSLVNDQGDITDLKIAKDKYITLFSLRKVPNLPGI